MVLQVQVMGECNVCLWGRSDSGVRPLTRRRRRRTEAAVEDLLALKR
jgi:hypothetical protein